MIDTSHSNEKLLGRLGRRRTYRCRICGRKFRSDFRLTPLPEDKRICDNCFTVLSSGKGHCSLFISAGVAHHHSGTE